MSFCSGRMGDVFDGRLSMEDGRFVVMGEDNSRWVADGGSGDDEPEIHRLKSGDRLDFCGDSKLDALVVDGGMVIISDCSPEISHFVLATSCIGSRVIVVRKN